MKWKFIFSCESSVGTTEDRKWRKKASFHVTRPCCSSLHVINLWLASLIKATTAVTIWCLTQYCICALFNLIFKMKSVCVNKCNVLFFMFVLSVKSFSLPICLLTRPPVYCLPTHPPTYLPTTYLSTHPPTHPSFYLYVSPLILFFCLFSCWTAI